MQRVSSSVLPTARTGLRFASSGPKPDVLVPVKASTAKEVVHYTSYALAAGIPAALVVGGSVATAVDVAMSVVIPVHAHLGIRSVVVDYVPNPASQQLALYALAGMTVLTAGALLKFNLTDIGMTESVKVLWRKPQPVATEVKE